MDFVEIVLLAAMLLVELAILSAALLWIWFFRAVLKELNEK